MAHGENAHARNHRRDAYTRRSGTTGTNGWEIDRKAKQKASRFDRRKGRHYVSREVAEATRGTR